VRHPLPVEGEALLLADAGALRRVLVMLHDIAANEKLDDSEDAGLEDDEDVDGEEDGADCLHAVHHGGPHYGQHEDQDPHHQDGDIPDFLDTSSVDQDHVD